MAKKLLAGGNSIPQAQKPARSKVTLPSTDDLGVTIDEFDRMKSELEKKTEALFRIEQAHFTARERVQEQTQTIAAYRRRFGPLSAVA